MSASSKFADTEIGRTLSRLKTGEPDQAGFIIIPSGIEALAIRLLLADRAEYSIDAQYYEFEDDMVGRLFLEALLRAANRGVRVRLLIDDHLTKGSDQHLAVLSGHKNFELRLYNPYRRKTARIIEGLFSFARINRRMHNKSFTVDQQVTVIGGRNIGDAYYSVAHEINFADLDVLGIGPIVDDVANMFGKYWHSELAVPVDQVHNKFGRIKLSPDKLLQLVSAARAEVSSSVYAEAVHSAILDTLESDLNIVSWSEYELLYDLPSKSQKIREGARIRKSLTNALSQAKEEVLLISPYFVPRRFGLRKFARLKRKGVKVSVITNSLATNNQIYAHGGYAPVRKQLLKLGVQLFELRADAHVVAKKHKTSTQTRATLHTKAYVIDRQKLFIGSFNFDPRSANINTEMGVFIHSPKIASKFCEAANRDLSSQTYRVILNDRGKVRWQDNNGELLKNEPQANAKLRLAGQIAQLLPIRGQV